MQDIIYNPGEVGNEVVNNKGKVVKIRKYHFTPEEGETLRAKWLEEVKAVDKKLLKLAGPHFFNPYRQGIYYYQIQTLFLLGCNQWHSLPEIVQKLEAYTSQINLKPSVVKTQGYMTAWDKFRGKSSRENARVCKDYIGRIQENFVLCQRLSRLHPYGYKLYQVMSAVDLKRVSRVGFPNGLFYYRLSTYDRQSDAKPIKDFSSFDFPRHEGKYVSYKFIGTIITKDKTIVEGVVKDG